jgi:RNA polymerase sigma factor (sigma-70 family)
VSDGELLERFCKGVGDGREAAFAELIRRHAAWVYAAARRQLADAAAAEEAAHATFIVLARKAKSLRPDVPLTAWLAGVLRRVVGRLRRDYARRRSHETRAAIDAAGVAPASDPADEAAWRELAPLLDAAVARLRWADREAVLLRFYRRLTFAEVGDALGVSEEAARKRVERAVEKLRATLQSRGATAAGLSATAFAALLWGQTTATAAPPGFVGVAGALPWSNAATPGTLAAAAAAATPVTAKAAALLVLGTLVAGLGVAAIVVPATPVAPAASVAPPATTRAVAAAPVRAVLRNGVGIELLGIAEYPSSEHPWFAPDGTPLPAAPYPRLGATWPASEGRVQREYAIALRTDPAGGEPPTIDLTGYRAGSRPPPGPMPRFSWYAPFDRQMRSVPGLRGVLVDDVPGRAPPLLFAIAAGPRVTRLASRNDGEVAAPAQDGVKAVSLGRPFEDAGASSIAYTTVDDDRALSVLHPRQDVRVVAIDVDGVAHPTNLRDPNYLSPADRATLPALDAILPRFAVRGVPFDAAIREVAQRSGLSIDIDAAAMAAAGDDPRRPVTLDARDASVADVLRRLMDEASLGGADFVMSVGAGGIVIRPFPWGAPRRTFTLYVDRLPLDRLSRFEVQSRPFEQWVEFENVSSEPGVGRAVVVRTSDDPPAGR